MGRAAQVYDFTLAAGANFEILAEGSYYRILTATGAVEVRRDDGSRVGPILEGQGERNSPFKRLTIRDLSGAANSGTVLICDGDFVDHRQAGAVESVNGNTRRTMANQAFYDGRSLSASAANYSMVQLWNPAGSTVNVFIESIIGSGFSPGTGFYLRTATAALANLSGKVRNKRFGGPAGISEIRWEQAAAMSGVELGSALYWPNGLGITELPFKTPIELEPNNGIIVVCSIVNASTYASFNLLELPR